MGGRRGRVLSAIRGAVEVLQKAIRHSARPKKREGVIAAAQKKAVTAVTTRNVAAHRLSAAAVEVFLCVSDAKEVLEKGVARMAISGVRAARGGRNLPSRRVSGRRFPFLAVRPRLLTARGREVRPVPIRIRGAVYLAQNTNVRGLYEARSGYGLLSRSTALIRGLVRVFVVPAVRRAPRQALIEDIVVLIPNGIPKEAIRLIRTYKGEATAGVRLSVHGVRRRRLQKAADVGYSACLAYCRVSLTRGFAVSRIAHFSASRRV